MSQIIVSVERYLEVVHNIVLLDMSEDKLMKEAKKIALDSADLTLAGYVREYNDMLAVTNHKK